jgi:hypothetical protein
MRDLPILIRNVVQVVPIRRLIPTPCHALLAIAPLTACASRGPLPLRPEPIAYVDTLPIPEPAGRETREIRHLTNEAVVEEFGRAISFRRLTGNHHEALNVTHFDDVVNSAWFEHRNGRRQITPAQVARGPETVEGPDTSRVLTVVEAKAQGISPGFEVRDARGDRYVFKFDPMGFLHLSSAAGVISNRLFYASGYHVPEDFIVIFDPGRLVVSPEATIENEEFEERPMSEEDIRRVLTLVDSLPDGRYLAVASRFVPGIPKGPFYFNGRRKDDSNDYYDHQFRRELRGLAVVSAWLNHVDMRFANTLDAYVPPGYLRHYLIDFAATLGSGTIRPHSPREGREYNFDLWPSLGRIATLGFFTMGWEDRPYEVIHPSIGWLPVEEFDPGTWKANWPNEAFNSVTARDGYWGAKLVGSFTDEQLQAAVRAGKLPTREAADTLATILSVRRDKLVAYWYARVTPIEDVVASRATGAAPADEALEVRFSDLGLEAGVWDPDETTYRFRFRHDRRGVDHRGIGRFAGANESALLIPLAGAEPLDPTSLSESERLATLEIRAERPGANGRATVVFLRWGGVAEGYRVTGLEH